MRPIDVVDRVWRYGPAALALAVAAFLFASGAPSWMTTTCLLVAGGLAAVGWSRR